MRAVMDNIRSALNSLIDGLQCHCAHAHHYCCMSGSTIQHPEQQKAESQNLSTLLYPHTHARCHQRAYCSSACSVTQSDVVVCDKAFLEQPRPMNDEAASKRQVLTSLEKIAKSEEAKMSISGTTRTNRTTWNQSPHQEF